MKNKEIEELLNYLKDNNNWYVIENKEEYNTEPYKILLPSQRNLLLSYIEQLENNRDKAIEFIDWSLPCIHDEEILNDLLNILKGDSDE